MKTIHRAVQAVRNGNRRAGGMLGHVKGRFSGLANEALNGESEIGDEVKKRGGEIFENAQDNGRQALKNTESWIKKNPASALGAAFVSGVVVNAWLRRKKE